MDARDKEARLGVYKIKDVRGKVRGKTKKVILGKLEREMRELTRY
jgi:hypothetical protein